jgi:sigma-B regulation protein RsbU (phosphoserine phosphatase)
LPDTPREQAPPNAAGGVADDFEDLFENAPCGYLSADRNGRITRANQTFSKWTGHTPSALIGRRFADLLSMAGRIFYETHFAPTLHMQGAFNEVALEVVAADGRTVPVLVNAVERRDEEGQPSFIRFTLFIAAQRRSYERELLEERDDAKAEVRTAHADAELREQFIAVLGHDLRNPLAAIASGVRLLGPEPLSDRGRTILTLMEGSVVRAAGLIDNVLDFARGRLGGGLTLTRADEPLEPVLSQIVAELRSIAPDQVIETHFALNQDVNCDRVRIGQLLSNILGNALTHGAKDVPVRLDAMIADDRLSISVTNGGDPIPPEAVEKLFQPFYRGGDQNKHHGLGLGLHIASEIASAHGGTLEARSNDVETCFTFTMPLNPA